MLSVQHANAVRHSKTDSAVRLIICCILVIVKGSMLGQQMQRACSIALHNLLKHFLLWCRSYLQLSLRLTGLMWTPGAAALTNSHLMREEQTLGQLLDSLG